MLTRETAPGCGGIRNAGMSGGGMGACRVLHEASWSSLCEIFCSTDAIAGVGIAPQARSWGGVGCPVQTVPHGLLEGAGGGLPGILLSRTAVVGGSR